ncbi:MAG: hypothetical protein HS116_03105 [Planctomycetes bacterium]|nr:hypothetical protein [Planctomycetota bacterium]
MILLQGAACALLLFLPCACGAAWVARSWKTRDTGTCLTLGSAVGLSAHLVALNVLSYLLLPVAAGWILAAAEAMIWAALVGLKRFRFEFRDWFETVRAAAPVLVPVALAWAYDALEDGGTDQLTHSAKAMVLSKHGLPVPHPFDPQSIFTYHYGPDLLGAAWGGMTGLPPWWTFNVWLAALGILALLLVLEGLRAVFAVGGAALDAWTARLGVAGFALGGSFAWTEWLNGAEPFFPPQRAAYACEGFAYCAKTLSMGAGWVGLLALLVAWLRWPKRDPAATDLWGPALPLGLLLGGGWLLAPHAAFPAACVLAAVGVARIVPRFVQAPAIEWRTLGVACALGLGLGFVQGGALPAQLLGFPEAAEARLAWTGSWVPSIPAMVDGRMTSVSLLEPLGFTLMWRELGPVAGAFPLLIVAWRGTSAHATGIRLILVATLPALALGLYARVGLNAFETYRFNQFALTGASLSAGIWLGGWCESKPTWLPRACACVLAGVLSLQGVRYLAQGVAEAVPFLPFQYDAGQAEAVAFVQARGALREGVLTDVLGFSAVPGLTGEPMACADPGTDRFNRPGDAWLRALDTPSPRNLRAARCRWLALRPDQWARSAPLLEGLSAFRRVQAFGEEPAYALYRYDGSWELPDGCLWQARKLRRHAATRALCDGRPVSERALLAWLDGNAQSAAESGHEIMLELAPGAEGRAPKTNLVWLLCTQPCPETGWRLEILEQRERAGGFTYAWTEIDAASAEKLALPERPHAWGFGFVPQAVAAIRLRANGPAPSICELYAGLAEP